ncbi:hypothetical protein [Streptodolium elevatio]|uniref:Low molecular weight antigen MTB12-like C-terminal domain-containing protein n=1 Tax=Streptodolium elevatio TaxID=3157996 RepID=A0ABV3DA04_9ACTN
MRDIRTRRMAWAALPVAGVLLLAGCGDDDKDEPKASPSASAPATSAAPSSSAPATSASATGGSSSAPAGAPADPATFTADQKAAAASFTQMLDAKVPVDQRKAGIQDAAGIAPLLDQLLANPALGTASIKVNDVAVSGDKAVVSFDVIVGGAPFYPNQKGEAVKQDGKWLVGKKTVCGFGTGLGIPAPPACAS